MKYNSRLPLSARLFFLGAGLSVLTAFIGCHKKVDPVASAPKKLMDMKEFEEDSPIPATLWKVIEGNYKPLALDPGGAAVKESIKEEGKEEGKEGKGGASKSLTEEETRLLKKKPPIEPISFHVLLVEKTPGVLGGQNWDLSFPAGGGYLDYRYFIPESNVGTFFLKVKYDGEMDSKETKVYYLSNAKVRQVDGKPMGNGCGRYFDISDYWKKSMDSDGLILNTVNNRHLSVTSGTLFFVAPYRGKLRVSHLSIRDSRHRDLGCSL